MSYRETYAPMKNTNLRTTNVSISLPPSLRDAARQAAFDDNRSFSSLVARLLSQYLQKEGYLEERAPVFRLRADRHLLPLSLRSARPPVFARKTCD